MLAWRGGRAGTALRLEGGSLHLLDWLTSIILAGLSPCRTLFLPNVPCIPPVPCTRVCIPSPQHSSWGAPALPSSPNTSRASWGGWSPPGLELLPWMLMKGSPRFGAAAAVPVSAVVWGTAWCPPRVVQRCAVFALLSPLLCCPNLRPRSPGAAGGAGVWGGLPLRHPLSMSRRQHGPPRLPVSVYPMHAVTVEQPRASLCCAAGVINKLCAVAAGRVTILCPPLGPGEVAPDPNLAQVKGGDRAWGANRGSWRDAVALRAQPRAPSHHRHAAKQRCGASTHLPKSASWGGSCGVPTAPRRDPLWLLLLGDAHQQIAISGLLLGEPQGRGCVEGAGVLPTHPAPFLGAVSLAGGWKERTVAAPPPSTRVFY